MTGGELAGASTLRPMATKRSPLAGTASVGTRPKPVEHPVMSQVLVMSGTS